MRGQEGDEAVEGVALGGDKEAGRDGLPVEVDGVDGVDDAALVGDGEVEEGLVEDAAGLREDWASGRRRGPSVYERYAGRRMCRQRRRMLSTVGVRKQTAEQKSAGSRDSASWTTPKMPRSFSSVIEKSAESTPICA